MVVCYWLIWDAAVLRVIRYPLSVIGDQREAAASAKATA